MFLDCWACFSTCSAGMPLRILSEGNRPLLNTHRQGFENLLGTFFMDPNLGNDIFFYIYVYIWNELKKGFVWSSRLCIYFCNQITSSAGLTLGWGFFENSCCSCLPCNHCSNWTWNILGGRSKRAASRPDTGRPEVRAGDAGRGGAGAPRGGAPSHGCPGYAPLHQIVLMRRRPDGWGSVLFSKRSGSDLNVVWNFKSKFHIVDPEDYCPNWSVNS